MMLTVIDRPRYEGGGEGSWRYKRSRSSGCRYPSKPEGCPEVIRDLSSELVLPATGVRLLAANPVTVFVDELLLLGAKAYQAHTRARYDWPVIADLVREVNLEVIS